MKENMICPACEKFQPKAQECAHCGVIIAKVQAATPESEEVSEKSFGITPTTAVVAAAMVAAVVAFLVIPDDPETVAEKPKETSTLPQATSGKLKLATATIQRANTQKRLRALVTKLNFVSIESPGFNPPSNTQGLAKLVQDGLLTKNDITDAWGRDFVYELKMGPDRGILGQEYEIRLHSAGADGVNNTADDIGM